jgi:hypothetical protein
MFTPCRGCSQDCDIHPHLPTELHSPPSCQKSCVQGPLAVRAPLLVAFTISHQKRLDSRDPLQERLNENGAPPPRKASRCVLIFWGGWRGLRRHTCLERVTSTQPGCSP